MVSQLTKTQSNIDDKFNRRSTEQRRLIMEIIRQAEGHLDADEI
jgi:Fe2+ or Zn2+ uptake regulation protein